MSKFALAAVAAMTMAVGTVPSLAADVLLLPEPIAETSSFSWEGPYVGGFIGGYPTAAQWAIGGEVGYNMLASDNILLGVSVQAAWYLTGYNPEAFIKGRAGFVANRFVIYGFGAAGNYVGGPGLYGAGIGVEVAATDTISFDAEGGIYTLAGGGGSFGRIETGLRFHF